MSRRLGVEQSNQCENEIDHKAPQLSVIIGWRARLRASYPVKISPIHRQWPLSSGSSTVSIASQGVKRVEANRWEMLGGNGMCIAFLEIKPQTLFFSVKQQSQVRRQIYSPVPQQLAPSVRPKSTSTPNPHIIMTKSTPQTCRFVENSTTCLSTS